MSHEVKDVEHPCPWCNGTGLFLYATTTSKERHCPADNEGSVYRTCGQCGGSGTRRS